MKPNLAFIKSFLAVVKSSHALIGSKFVVSPIIFALLFASIMSTNAFAPTSSYDGFINGIFDSSAPFVTDMLDAAIPLPEFDECWPDVPNPEYLDCDPIVTHPVADTVQNNVNNPSTRKPKGNLVSKFDFHECSSIVGMKCCSKKHLFTIL